MADTSATVPASVQSFNARVADLLKTVEPDDLLQILSHPSSLLRTSDNNNGTQNQNRRASEQAA